MRADLATPAPATSADRRTALLDTAADLVATGGVDAVSMEAVATAARVSRALVYKHFANRGDLLASLYERESARLHAELASAVEAAPDLAGMLAALVRGVIAAQSTRGATLAALSAEARPSTHRDVRRRRDARTLAHFTRQAVHELGVAELDARAGLALMLGSLPTVLARWRLRPTPATARELEDAYVAMAMGGLKELAARR